MEILFNLNFKNSYLSFKNSYLFVVAPKIMKPDQLDS
jgi:hypothetical protein